MSRRLPPETSTGSRNHLQSYPSPDVPSKIITSDRSYEKAIVDQPVIPSAAMDHVSGVTKRLRASSDSDSSSSKPKKQVGILGDTVLSVATVENARYSLVDGPFPDHWNEDARLIINDQPRFKVMAVFDGHDGSNAVELVCNHFSKLFSHQFLHEVKEQDVSLVLEKFFMSAEYEFFRHIREFVSEKKALQSRIPEVSMM